MLFLKKIVAPSLIGYLLIAGINTLFGYIIIFSLIFSGVTAELSNFAGYAIGILLSFYLNKKYNFKSKQYRKSEFGKFVASMLISYLANLAVLSITYRALNMNVYFAQVIGGVVYTSCGYCMTNYWVFEISKRKSV